MRNIRAGIIAISFILFTAPLMLVQWTFLIFNSKYKITFPHWYHKNVCRLLGIRIHITGNVERNNPAFLISNHTSWLDITVLSAIAPISFIAKKEVASWPFFGWLAKLQRTVFVDRQRRTASGHATNEIMSRLENGDRIVLFAEGTSNNGNIILPFKTALFAAADLKYKNLDIKKTTNYNLKVQTITIAYTHRHGLPMGRKGRPNVAWYGDMDLMDHMWNLFGTGPYDVQVHIQKPLDMKSIKDRKELAKISEASIRNNLSNLLNYSS